MDEGSRAGSAAIAQAVRGSIIDRFRIRLCLATMWVLERHGVLAVARMPNLLAANLPEAFLEVFGSLLDSVAWACVFFAVIVPESHPAYCHPISRLMSYPQLRNP